MSELHGNDIFFRIQECGGAMREFFFPAEATVVTVGSSPDCGISDSSGSAAWKHAEIHRENEKYILRTLDKRAGTFVNSIPVAERELRHSDVIQLGRLILIFNASRADSAKESVDNPDGKFGFAELAGLTEKLERNITSVFKGKPEVVRNLLVCLLADGHLLLEDAPGVGKSLLAQALAKSIRGSYRRIQFTPDMMPSDVTGMTVFDSDGGGFRFVPGPIFGNVVLADEINRTTPRTQSSLLECMAESTVTIDGEGRILPKPFFVAATQNPEDYHGTYPLPEPQLDRFLMRLFIGYPAPEVELEILNTSESGTPLTKISGVVESADIVRAQALIRNIRVSGSIKEYIIALANGTRTHQALVNGCSPRATLALMRASQSMAACEGRSYVTPHDIRRLYKVVLSHRLALKLRWKAQWKTVDNVLEAIVDQLRIPEEDRV